MTLQPLPLQGLSNLPSGLQLATLSLLLLMISGCNSVPKDDFKQKFALASEHFGQHFEFFYVPSYGWIADREFVKITPLGDPSADAYQLADRLRFGASQTTRVAVYSPAPEKAHNILRNALFLQQGQELPYLEVLFIGDTETGQRVETEVKNLGGRFYRIE